MGEQLLGENFGGSDKSNVNFVKSIDSLSLESKYILK